MKDTVSESVANALAVSQQQGLLEFEQAPPIQVEVPKQREHGDFSSNIAMLLAKPCRRPPREIAEVIAGVLSDDAAFEKVEVAGPGFLNFYLRNESVFEVIDTALNAGTRFGRNEVGAGRKIQVEFVSANPTGPLHVGHGRGAAIGSALSNLLEFSGYQVTREYYVNDAGRQMDILALSVWLRYAEAQDQPGSYPSAAYQGIYINEIAQSLLKLHGQSFSAAAWPVTASSDPDGQLDELIVWLKGHLGDSVFLKLREFAKDSILATIADDLEAFGVGIDNWYSEYSLIKNGAIDQ